MISIRTRSVICIILSIFLTACSAIKSGDYTPLPRSEAKFYAEARRDILPAQVLTDPSQFGGTLVGWTGVIQEISFGRDDLSEVAYINADHHFFGWREDTSTDQHVLLLSPNGSGKFAAGWRLRTDNDKAFIKQFSPGDMLVAYGYPSIVRDGTVGLLPTRNIRAVKPGWYRFEDIQ